MLKKRIFYHDTDAGGVVYYGRYLNYLEEARTEFLDQNKMTVKDLHAKGFLYAVRKCNITYKSPARYGDIIQCETILKKVTAAQMMFQQNIFDESKDRLMITAEVTLVSLDRDFKPTVIPDDIREQLEATILQ